MLLIEPLSGPDFTGRPGSNALGTAWDGPLPLLHSHLVEWFLGRHRRVQANSKLLGPDRKCSRAPEKAGWDWLRLAGTGWDADMLSGRPRKTAWLFKQV